MNQNKSMILKRKNRVLIVIDPMSLSIKVMKTWVLKVSKVQNNPLLMIVGLNLQLLIISQQTIVVRDKIPKVDRINYRNRVTIQVIMRNQKMKRAAVRDKDKQQKSQIYKLLRKRQDLLKNNLKFLLIVNHSLKVLYLQNRIQKNPRSSTQIIMQKA